MRTPRVGDEVADTSLRSTSGGVSAVTRTLRPRCCSQARSIGGLDRGRDLDRLDRLRQPIPSALPCQFVCTSVRTVSPRKKGFPRLTRSCLIAATSYNSRQSSS